MKTTATENQSEEKNAKEETSKTTQTLLGAVTKGSLVNLEISAATAVSKPSYVFRPYEQREVKEAEEEGRKERERDRPCQQQYHLEPIHKHQAEQR
jgi:hypothetical protein